MLQNLQVWEKPNMQHIGRTHRISIAWLYNQLRQSDIKMFRADSELMAADIFTKHFPESKRDVWQSNLNLINVLGSPPADISDFQQQMVQSLRGDLDAPKVSDIAAYDSEVEANTCLLYTSPSPRD